MQQFHLSKSKYTRFCQCPKMLWLDKYRPELAKQDPTLQRRFDEGTLVGKLAQGLFGKSLDVTAQKDGKLDLAAMLSRTKEAIEEGVENICEAAFSAENCYCAVDVLHKEKDGYAIYEVKSSTSVSDVYLWDIAYQKWVLEKAGIQVVGTYLVHINSKYVRNGDIDIHKFFRIVDVSEDIKPYYPLVAHNVEKAQDYLARQEEPTIVFGPHCKKPYECAYWEHCSECIPTPSIFDLYNMHFDKACRYYYDGIITYSDAIQNGIKLSEKQQRQIEFTLSDIGIRVDADGVRDFLNTLWEPLYFLDFETYQTAIPKYDGMKPYQQIPFQYSLHYFNGETENGREKLFHKEYLAKEGIDPRREIAERLIEDIPMNACILAYNKAFECTRIKELAATFPDLKDALLQRRDNIRDLWDVFKGGYVYNRAMGGSFSIKSVLPALFPDDPELNYHNLEGVHNGGEATDTYLMLETMSPEERAKKREELLKYCHLDTYAMVRIYWKLKELLG